MKNKRVFVSGGAGVIGSVLVDALHKMGATVFVGDLKPRPAYWPAEIRYRQGDLNYITREELAEFAPDYFFHLAATFERSVETYDFWHENYRHNVRLSNHLMTCLKDIPSMKKVVFASSYLIYDPMLYSFSEPAAKAVRLKEEDVILPRNICGAAKLLHEIELRFLEEFKDSYTSFHTVYARIFRVYGKNSRDIISRWVRSLLRGEKLTVYKKEGMFDYIYAGEVAKGLIHLAISPATGVVNLGNDQARRVSDVLDILRQYFPHMELEEGQSDILYEASQANMDRFFTLTGWKPERQLEDVIPEIIEFEKDRLKENIDHTVRQLPNVLVTSISRKVPLLRAVKQALRKVGDEIRLFGGDIDAGCIGRYFTDEFWLMPHLIDLTPETCIAYCEQNGIGLIIPTRDGELPYFARHKAVFAAHGIEVMVSDERAIDICLDKQRFYDELSVLGYPVIPTAREIEGVSAELYVVKERYGAGSHSLGLKLSEEAARVHATNLEEPIYQPYVAGEEMSVDVYLTHSGRAKGAVVRRRELVVHGESQITTTVQHYELEQLCIKIAEKLELSGHVIFQVFVTPDDFFHIIECNPRFGGASTLSLAVGLDSFYWSYLEAMGVDVADYPFVRSNEEKTMVRYPQDVIL
ncbi:NAD-dependent epimerase/dehydratase family protein [Aneurinibacillus aneurinilyticus]|uniref:NAD-dependent epimerase/dehydratase family protein n=1 Tax=Aneurinibacillus aneurinilyticus TaxID=1391 RepID=UPI002E1B6AC6|nr:NAD-dependent epimerase/dehydratase family protein [Aneurinibacillus aneurinilyticus]MED0670805.1 NAD-dependent epimerase/dehydratase family protein [Aneurinibacillus aneurinilyticus]